MTHNDFIYDIETPLDTFICVITHAATGTRWIFEVSQRIDQSRQFVEFIYWLRDIGARMVGYNNEGFDYLVIHHLVGLFNAQGYFTAYDAYLMGQAIIDADRDQKFRMMVWPDQRIVPQVDLFKIHHFDNFAKSTSLKKLEVAMKSWSVQDLPFSPHEPRTSAQIDAEITYCCHDVRETHKFYDYSREQIAFRDKLSAQYPKDFTNYNDTKIGEEFFKMELERAMPGSTGSYNSPARTVRQNIVIGDVILPYVKFRDPEFTRILEFFKSSVIKCDKRGVAELKGFFKNLHCTVNDFTFHFGAGGIHGSVSGQSFHADADHEIIDVDVTSYYPDLAIQNKFYPKHLSEAFCDVYSDVFQMRKQHDKKSAESAMLKLALNGVYGKSNSIHSPFFDPQYTMSITVNGQLLMAMLAEWVMELDGVTLIQANTDGITCRVHRGSRDAFMQLCRDWEAMTKLGLEDVTYDRMFVRDVNSYVGDYGGGKVKRIGAFAHVTPMEDPYTREVQWHKNHSSLVVAKAACARLLDGTDPVDFINAHTDAFDFMRCVKVPRSMRLELVEPGRETNEVIQNITRYYISTDGPFLNKWMPPTARKPDTPRENNAIDKGFMVGVCNDARDFDWSRLNRQYYIDEARKLIMGVGL